MSIQDHITLIEDYLTRHPDDEQAKRVLFRLRSCKPDSPGPVRRALLDAVNKWDAARKQLTDQ